MQVDFENLKPHIDDICFKLGIFAEVYSFVSPLLNILFSLLIRMIEMSEESILIKNELNKGMEILSSRVNNYVGFVLAGIDDLEYRAEIQDKTWPSQETGWAAQRGHEGIRYSNWQTLTRVEWSEAVATQLDYGEYYSFLV